MTRIVHVVSLMSVVVSFAVIVRLICVHALSDLCKPKMVELYEDPTTINASTSDQTTMASLVIEEEAIGAFNIKPILDAITTVDGKVTSISPQLNVLEETILKVIDDKAAMLDLKLANLGEAIHKDMNNMQRLQRQASRF